MAYESKSRPEVSYLRGRQGSDEANRIARAYFRKQIEADVAAGLRPESDLPLESRLAKALEQQKSNGQMPPDMTIDQLMQMRERMAHPRSGTVPPPLDMVSERERKADYSRIMLIRKSGDQSMAASEYETRIRARDARWEAEKPEYERRLAECDAINDICENAVQKIRALKGAKGRESVLERQLAFAQVYEIAVTGHLKGVSEKLLGSQAVTLRNYEHHFREDRRAGKRPIVPMDYKVLRHYENIRTGQPQDSPLPLSIEWTAASVQSKLDAVRAQNKNMEVNDMSTSRNFGDAGVSAPDVSRMPEAGRSSVSSGKMAGESEPGSRGRSFGGGVPAASDDMSLRGVSRPKQAASAAQRNVSDLHVEQAGPSGSELQH